MLFTANTATGGFDAANIEVDVFGGSPPENARARRHFGRYLAQRPSGLREQGHAVCRAVRSGHAGSARHARRRCWSRSPTTPQAVPRSSISREAERWCTAAAEREADSSPCSGWTARAKRSRCWPNLDTYGRPSLSPDGQRLALEVTEGSGTDIWVYDWQRDTMTRLTFSGSNARSRLEPRRPVYRVPSGGRRHVCDPFRRSGQAAAIDPEQESPSIRGPSRLTESGWRSTNVSSGTAYDLWTVPLESDGAGLRAGKPEVFLQTPADERHPSFSPDGRWLAYSSDESGTFQVYVRAFPDKGGKWQISNSGGTYPMWSRNGHELFFETLDNQIMVGGVHGEGRFLRGRQTAGVVREADRGHRQHPKNVDLAPDGKRIVALMPVETPEAQKAQNHVIFLENFFDELRRKVPVGK